MDAAGWVPVSELLDSLMGMATEAAVYEVIRDCPKVPHHPPWLLLPASRDFTAVWRIAQLEAMINIQTVHVEQFVNCFTVQTSSELQQQIRLNVPKTWKCSCRSCNVPVEQLWSSLQCGAAGSQHARVFRLHSMALLAHTAHGQRELSNVALTSATFQDVCIAATLRDGRQCEGTAVNTGSAGSQHCPGGAPLPCRKTRHIVCCIG